MFFLPNFGALWLWMCWPLLYLPFHGFSLPLSGGSARVGERLAADHAELLARATGVTVQSTPSPYCYLRLDDHWVCYREGKTQRLPAFEGGDPQFLYQSGDLLIIGSLLNPRALDTYRGEKSCGQRRFGGPIPARSRNGWTMSCWWEGFQKRTSRGYRPMMPAGHRSASASSRMWTKPPAWTGV